jgi:tRNA nucleotidyltransferase (CCA-adding enzyme)
MREALERIHGALGAQAGLVLVGGAVRDRLLGREGADWDLASALLPQEVMDRCQAAGLRVIPTGLKHGTVTILEGGHPFEITTFRGEGEYLDGRRPETVRLGVALEEDLARRDFTINAMALPVGALDHPDWVSRVVDPFGGREDLARGLIKAVGDPLERFQEDGLRALRACRFASQLAFSMDPGTLAAIPQRLEVARKVAVERAFTELTKLLQGQAPALGLDPLAATGLLDLWMAELRPQVMGPAWALALDLLPQLPPQGDLRWAALLLGGGGSLAGLDLAKDLLLRLRASTALIRQVAALVRHHATRPGPAWSDGQCRRFLRALREDGLPLDHWLAFHQAWLTAQGLPRDPALARLDTLALAGPPLTVKELALDGRAIMALLQRPGGPWLSRLQGELLEAVLDDPGLNTQEALAQRIRNLG